MFGSAVLDTALGLTFIFFVLSTMCSTTFGLIGRMTRLKGRLLQNALLYMLEDEVRDKVMAHPLIENISLTGTSLYDRLMQGIFDIRSGTNNRNAKSKLTSNNYPPYIPPDVFATVLIDLFVEVAKERSLEEVLIHLEKAANEEFEAQTRLRIRNRINRLLDENEDEALAFTEEVLGRVGSHMTEAERDMIVKDVKRLLADRGNIMTLIDQGIEFMNLPERTTAYLRRQIELLYHQRLRDTTLSVQADFREFSAKLEGWFNNSMDSLTAIFKIRMQIWLAVIATVITLFFNINTLAIADTLWTNPTVREAVVASASAQVEAGQTDPTTDNPAEIFQDDLQSLDIPVGWTKQELKPFHLDFLGAQVTDANRPVPDPFARILGWLITIGAAMFGAPFWFDVLNKIVNLRISNKPKE